MSHVDSLELALKEPALVTSLDLVREDIPADATKLAPLTALRKLRLRAGPAPALREILSSLPALRDLELLHLQVPPDAFAGLSALPLERLVIEAVPATLPDAPGAMAETLVELQISFAGLTELPAMLHGLRKLETLDLRNNRLVTIPASLGDHTGLRRLVLSSNIGLTGLDEEALGRLAQLRAFVLDGASLPALPASLFTLVHLEELVLLDCISQPPAPFPAALAALTKLRTLRVGGFVSTLPGDLSALAQLEVFQWRNAMMERFPTTIFSLATLRELAINGHLFATVPRSFRIPDALGQLSRLEVLTLSNTGVTHVPESIGGCRALRSLDLAMNPIGQLPTSIGELQALDVLDVKKCGLASLPASLGNCASLRCLWLDDNPLTTLPDTFANLGKLQNVGLANAKLTALPQGLRSLTGLKSLGLTGNLFDPEAMKDLAAFGKQQRGYFSVDPPRKAKPKAAKPPKPSPARLSPAVLAQAQRLGATFTERPVPAKGLELEFATGARVLPEAFRQLLKDVSWRGIASHVFTLPHRSPTTVTLFVPGDLANEYECMKNHAYLDFGHTAEHDLLLLDLDGNADVADPDVYYLMDGEYWQTDALRTGLTLSQFLATGRPV